MPSPEKCASALGEMIISFQALESKLLELFASMTDKEDLIVGLVIGSQLSFGKLCSTTEALGKHRIKAGELLAEISIVINESCECEAQRNKYIHSCYGFGWQSGGEKIILRAKHRIKKNKGFVFGFVKEDLNGANELVRKMECLARKIDKLLYKLRGDGIIADKSNYNPFVI